MPTQMPGLGVLAAFNQARNQSAQEGAMETQQVGALQGILAKVRAEQQEQQLKGVLAQSGGDPAKAVQALLQAGTPKALSLAAQLKGMMPKPPEDRVIAPGGTLLGADGNVKFQAPMRPDKEQAPSNLSRLYREMQALPEGDPQRAAYANAIRKESETAKQISPTIVNNQPAPVTTIVVKDASSDTGWSYKDARTGRVTSTGAPPPASDARADKIATAKRKTVGEMNQAITELARATADGGLIDKSTGSGAGAAVDAAAGFFGHATPGSIAVGQMKPIFDLGLKMVPRFEGPQSDKDTQSYKEAAGELANPNTPNARKKAAGKEVLRLMTARRDQFISKDLVGTEADSAPAASPNPTPTPSRRSNDVPAGIDPKVWGAMTPEEKRLFK